MNVDQAHIEYLAAMLNSMVREAAEYKAKLSQMQGKYSAMEAELQGLRERVPPPKMTAEELADPRTHS